MIKCVSAKDKRSMLELAVKNAPVEARKLRIAQEIPGAWIVDYGSGDEKNGWYSIYALGVALGIVSASPRHARSVPRPKNVDLDPHRVVRENIVVFK